MIALFIKLTKIDSENLIAAIHDHFVRDYNISQSAAINSVPQPNLTLAINRLNEIAETVERINELKYTS